MWVGLSQEDPTRPGNAPDESDRSEDEDEDREEKPRQVVSTYEIRRQVLERLDEGVCYVSFSLNISTGWLMHRSAYVQDIETIDVNDVSWIDGSDGDDETSSNVRVKDVNAQAKSGVAAFKKKAWMDVDFDLDVEVRSSFRLHKIIFPTLTTIPFIL